MDLFLNEASTGEEYSILEIKNKDEYSTKLIELGMINNSTIKVINNSKIFSSIIIKIKGALWAISKSIAKNIKIRKIK